MRLFFVFVCCLAIPLVARAADQDSNKKKKQTTQGPQQQQVQQQTGKQSMHDSANTVSQLNNVSQLKSHSDHHGLNAQTNNVSAVQSSAKGKLETKRFNLSN